MRHTSPIHPLGASLTVGTLMLTSFFLFASKSRVYFFFGFTEKQERAWEERNSINSMVKL